MRVIGYSMYLGQVYNTDGDISDDRDQFEYLLKPRKDALRIFSDLDRDVSSVLSFHLTTGDIEELGRKWKIKKYPYLIKFVPYKLFSLKREGAFSYYANAKWYIKDELIPSAFTGASRAKEVGEEVLSILNLVGVEVTSLVNPVRSYQFSQVKKLREVISTLPKDSIRYKVIEEIGSSIFHSCWNADK